MKIDLSSWDKVHGWYMPMQASLYMSYYPHFIAGLLICIWYLSVGVSGHPSGVTIWENGPLNNDGSLRKCYMKQ